MSLVLSHHVDHPELQWVQAQGVGQVLHHHLDGGVALGAAGRPDVRVGRLVGQHRGRRDVPRLAVVHVPRKLGRVVGCGLVE